MENFFKRIISSLLLLPLVLYLIIEGSYGLIFLTLICFFISCYEWYLMTKNFILKLSGIIFLFFSFYSFYAMSEELTLILFILLICIATDIGGYIFGKLFKGPKLTKISPKKTYAGLIGAYFLSLIVFLIIIIFFDDTFNSIQNFLLTITISTVSQLGDLIVSYFKRLYKIKDTGKILPGHGGLLDRIDGMIFSFPFLYLIYIFNFIDI